MLKVLFYGYYTGIMSCRGMWNELSLRADFMYLAAGQVPNFRTINEFRLKHMKVIPILFAQIVFLCTQLGMVEFKYLAIDGEVIQANASYKQNKHLKGLKEEFARTRESLRKLVEKEPNEDFTREVKRDQVNKVTAKLDRLEQMRARVEEFVEEQRSNEQMVTPHSARKSREKDKIHLNMTDKDARQLSHKGRKGLPSYNHQSAVDGKYGVVCAVQTTQRGDHPDDLLPLVDRVKQNTGGAHENVLADCSFSSYEVLQKLEHREEEYYIPDQQYRSSKKTRKPRNRYALYYFRRNPDGTYTCPDGFPMEYQGRRLYRNGLLADRYDGTHCEQCSDHDACTKMNRRQIYIDLRFEYMAKMREKLDSDRGRLRYKKRQGISEPIHGDDQRNRGWTQHHLRGLVKASTEFILIRIATNLRKIASYRPQEILALG
jgi:hypothetical protein